MRIPQDCHAEQKRVTEALQLHRQAMDAKPPNPAVALGAMEKAQGGIANAIRLDTRPMPTDKRPNR